MTRQFLKQKHIDFIKSLDQQTDRLEYWLTEHLRMNGLYWGLTALYMMGAKDELPKEDVVKYVLSCQTPSGGFGAAPRHDAHLLSTLSALQILYMEDALSQIDTEKVTKFVVSLQIADTGAVMGDSFGEIDTRFVYIAIQSLSLLGTLDRLNVDKAVEFLSKCQNFDGGFGLMPGAESHAAQVFTCLAALAIVNRLDVVDQETLGWWLCERQLSSGGLNGRPEKLPDVCYSWWVLSSLDIIGKLDWIDHAKLREFILDAQDPEKGGIADREGNVVDVYHTIFGIAGLSLMKYENLIAIDPVYCLPYELTNKIKKFPYKN